MPHTLLQAKLHTPHLEHPLVDRPELLRRLEAGAGGAATLIVAPAGYGKTTLAAQWAEQTQQPVVWLSLDAGDNDLAQFLSTVVAGIQTLYPAACGPLRSLLDQAPLPDAERLAVLLSNEINRLPARFVLVLDDFHYATEHAVQRLLGELLSRPPRQMHLLLIARSQPALALSRLRAGRGLTELYIPDLRFNEQETDALLAQKWGRSCPPQAASALYARTEGWVAGLHLLAISWSAAERALPDQLLEGPAANPQVAEYLLEQVLQQQSPLVREFLLKTSILQRMNPALVEAVTGVSQRQASASLPVLVRADLFLNTVDAAGEWYAYHALFRELLLKQLRAVTPPEQVAVLHRRAAAWLCCNRYFDDALEHAFAADDEQLALQIVIDHSAGWLEEESWRTVERRLNLFAGRRAEQHPWLLMVKAQILVLQFRWNALLPLLKRAEQQMADASWELAPLQVELLHGYLDVLWAVHWSSQTDAPQAIAAVERAMHVLPAASHYVRGLVQLALTLSLQSSGAGERAEQMLQAALAQAEVSPAAEVAVLRPMMCLLSLSFAEGNIAAAARLGQILLHKAAAAGSLFNQHLAHLALGAAAYEINDLEAAITHFTLGVQLRHAGQARGSHECLVGLALANHALGRSEAAKAALAQLDELHLDLSNNSLLAESTTLQRRLGLPVSDASLGTALRRCAPIRMSAWYGWLETPALTVVRSRLATAQVQDLASVEALLNELWDAAVQLHKPARQAAVLALKALLHHRRKQRASALDLLRQSLRLAEKHGLVRSIADAGPALVPLLAELAAVEPSAWVDQVRAAVTEPPVKTPAVAGRRGVEPLAAPLTRREREVLLLLGQQQTDREIAEALVISPLTVRTHIENLSSKLEANGRRAIVNRAREHGLLA